MRFSEVPTNIMPAQRIDGRPFVIWCGAPFYHMPRTEDFGETGFKAHEGVALTTWSGIDLVPHNLWYKTPFYPR